MTSKLERIRHSFGKSFRDLLHVRQGKLNGVVDVVVCPESEQEIIDLLELAERFQIELIPFGGGSNIAGCLSARSDRNRPIISLDMCRLNRVLSVDVQSQSATVQTGVYGPDLEQQFEPYGVTLGHFPDSFRHSTLGGWVATRSAGMQSDKYGKIEDMVLAMRVVTPRGVIVTRPVPRASNGVDINRLCIGSEGSLGVISEVTLQVHRQPAKTLWLGYLFHNFESGVAAIQCVAADGIAPVVTRLNDAEKTALSFAFKAPEAGMKKIVSKGFKLSLQHIKRMDLDHCCLAINKFEGSRKQIRCQRRAVDRVYRQHGGVCLGRGPGESFERGKFDFPYLRDWLLDRRVFADVSETATLWSNVLPLYRLCQVSLQDAITATGCRGWVGCHVSHTYHCGASLYFTFAWHDNSSRVEENYDTIKHAIQDAFMAGGATLSHHHAVGTEHRPWLAQDISPTGVLAVEGLKATLDPHGIMNPGKLIR